ncbi:MAG: diguanylate cyclase (GGDEF)-like protein [Gammaproteobacteria bacterium]|jgi:diguanylate cyclase (GGDEF)-like protein
MTFEIKKFTIVVLALFTVVLLLLTFWLGSNIIAEQRLIGDKQRLNLYKLQIEQLEEKQKLWLQSQFYLVASLLEDRPDNRSIPFYLRDYYQRNPGIISIYLTDQVDLAVPADDKISCFGDGLSAKPSMLLMPVITGCSSTKYVILEMAGPLTIKGQLQILSLNMDYFQFIAELESLVSVQFKEHVGDDDLKYFMDIRLGEDRDAGFALPLAINSVNLGVMYLAKEPFEWSGLSWKAVGLPIGLLLVAVLLLYLFFYLAWVGPLYRLSAVLSGAGSSASPENHNSSQVVFMGLSEIFKSVQLLSNMAKKDSVTGLDNRVIFEDRLIQAIREGRRSGRKFALILIESADLVDNQHRYSLYFRDVILKQIADRLQAGMRESDSITKFDQDLFALLIETIDEDQISGLVDKIFYKISKRYLVEGQETELGFKIGVALYPDHGGNLNELYRNANDALRIADNNDWPIQFYSGDDSQSDGFTIIQALRKAIESDELKLVFQPVVDVKNHRTNYFEALLRWKNPGDHSTSIGRIIELAEKNQLIMPLTNWVIKSVCHLIAKTGDADLVIGINLSMVDLHNDSLPGRIRAGLEQYNIKPGQLAVEITEGQIMQDIDKVSEVLAHIGVMGLSISIDDFGTGQASLTYLRELPVEKLKIDQSFVRDMATNIGDQLIVKATIDMAHALDIKVVAEGVETFEVHELLRELNCDYIQGYYISRPLEAEELQRWLQR